MEQKSTKGRVRPPAYPQVENWVNGVDIKCRYCGKPVTIPPKTMVRISKGELPIKFEHTCGNIIKMI